MKKGLIELFKKYFVAYLPFVTVFLASLYNTVDSDLGWHLKYGEYFFRHFSILRDNIFSTDMPDFHWINSSWATDLLSYFTFSRFGFAGITILGSLIVTATFYFISKAAVLSFWEQSFLFPILVYLEEPLNVVSFRGHQISLLFISILLYLLRSFETGRRKMILLAIPLFILWSNLHGEFILGMAIFTGWTIFHILRLILLRHKSIIKTLFKEKYIFLILTSSVIGTIINPFGIGPYMESLKHFGNPLQKYIIEWLPFASFSDLWWNLAIWSLVIFLSILILRKKRKLIEMLPYMGLTVILLILTFTVRRYAWAMYYVSIIPASIFFKFLKPKNKIFSYLLPAVSIIIFYLYVTQIQFPSQMFPTMDWNRYCKEYVKCSPQSAEFLQNANLSGKLLSFYNWGGWLIWKYPSIKPSIDGRMHLWQDDKGYSAFKYYYPYEQNWKDVDKSIYDIVYMPPTKPIHKQMMELVEEKKWKIAYKDKYAYIFVRIPSNERSEK